MAGDSIKPFGSGKSAFRFLVPKEKLQNDSKTADFVKEDGDLVMWVADDRRIVMYPCSNDTIMNFVCIHPSDESEAHGEGEIMSQVYEWMLTYFQIGVKVEAKTAC